MGYCRTCGQPSGVEVCPECEVDYEEEYGMTLAELRERDADKLDMVTDWQIREALE